MKEDLKNNETGRKYQMKRKSALTSDEYLLSIVEAIEISVSNYVCILLLVSMRLLFRAQFAICFISYESHELELHSAHFSRFCIFKPLY